MKLSERIAAARKRLKLSQAQLAEKLGVSPGTVGSWESDAGHAHGIRKKRLVQVAKILGLEVTDLLN
jgi:transcriptional regulator with XRE-family HTH domain